MNTKSVIADGVDADGRQACAVSTEASREGM